ncbi:helix-turn-helix transcriptional regulator [Sphaerisporangium rubeum]|uniref:Sugar-specific transcriptional regulator TrmB/DNA-binding CsgD family transcriptional regulator n=1 Tax=Sphaerisporangium rubeum TaxID=321317 RepID=A0A7X0IKC5_9ACTN|nr:LuxR family transcriptional regulator [Sphaerisporangium rubeum]MBB6476761.1 sugar-specific transcriptional regulator TrmB/DNA-binding CsgD family transcriptional regulator [Sphaerisporangium rubeum]
MLDPRALDPSTADVYRALLQHPEWGIGDIARHLSVPEERVREAFDLLADMALLRPSRNHPTLFRPVRPEVGLASLLAQTEAELQRRQQQIVDTRAAIAAIAMEYDAIHDRERGSFERLEGLEQVRSRLEELAYAAQDECMSFMPGGAQTQEAMEASEPLDRQALERGVRIRTIYQDSFRNDADTLRYAQWLAGLGGQTRSSPTLPMSLLIVDRSVAMVPLNPRDPRLGAMEVSADGIVTALCALFEQVWAVAVPFGEARVDEHGLSPFEHELLLMLLDGQTDEGAARRLGVSLRTVRRTMSTLMARLDARSRFQAGARAVQRGWI